MNEDIRPTYHHGDLRAAAVALAVEQIRRSGVACLSLRDLAAELKVTHRALYRHFPDKEALIRAAVGAAFSRLATKIEAHGASHGVGLPAHSLWVVYVDFVFDEPNLYRAMYGLSSGQLLSDPDPGPAVRRVIDLAAAAFAIEGETARMTRDRVIAALAMTHGLCDLYLQGVLRAASPRHAKDYIAAQLGAHFGT